MDATSEATVSAHEYSEHTDRASNNTEERENAIKSHTRQKRTLFSLSSYEEYHHHRHTP